MRLTEIFFTALSGLRANKIRSSLTILGIVIGIAAVMTMITIGQGAQQLIVHQIISLGSNNIFIEPGPWTKRMERGGLMQSIVEEMDIKTLKYEDALAIEKLPEVSVVAPFVMGVDRASYGEKSKKVNFWGTTPNSSKISDIRLIMGRDISDEDVKSMARVVVLGYKTWQDLFDQENPLAKTIRVKKVNLKVIGVIEERGPQFFLDLDEGVYLPLSTVQKLLLGEDFIRWIVARAKDEKSLDEAVGQIRQLLRERHNIYNPEQDLSKDDFKVLSQVEMVRILNDITGIFTIFLSSVAAISLVVGGIGIMNIMLVSVTERTREIGLRMAVGATKREILWQFLLEALLLTLAGGILGIILGFLFSFGASFIFVYSMGIPLGFSFRPEAAILGMGVASITGLIFGLYPAYKASRLNPIDALRYE